MLLCPRHSFAVARRLPVLKAPLSSSTRYSNTFREEDQSPYYRAELFYPARVGETIRGYRLVSKLGWGSNSTVWLAHQKPRWPWQSDRYVALKITNTHPETREADMDELEVSRHLGAAADGTEATQYIRLVLDTFTLDGPGGRHLVLAFEPLRESVLMLGRRLGQRGVSLDLAQPFLQTMVKSLVFIHAQNVVHGDLKCSNFMLVLEDDSVLLDYVKQQESTTPITKTVDGHVITKSQKDFGPLRKGMGFVKLGDFGLSVILKDPSSLQYGSIQPLGSEAPEVLFSAGWTKSADIWNLGIMLLELLTETPLLLGRDEQTAVYSRALHVAQLHRLLGPPPKALLDRAASSVLDDLFTPDGIFKHPHLIPPPSFTLTSHLPNIKDEEKAPFLEFASKMLKWLPEERATAQEIHDDPWFEKKIAE